MNQRYVPLFPASGPTGTGRGDSQTVAPEAQDRGGVSTDTKPVGRRPALTRVEHGR